jgi:uncharacterized protein
MRVVLDTNLWVSGLLWRGLPWQLLQLAEQGLVEPCVSAAMAAELAEVLAYPKLAPRLGQLGVTAAELAERVVGLASVWDVPAFDGDPIVKADPDDDIFLLCATSAPTASAPSATPTRCWCGKTLRSHRMRPRW